MGLERKGVQWTRGGEATRRTCNHLEESCREGWRLSEEESCGEGSTVVGAQLGEQYILGEISPLLTTEFASGNFFIRSAMRRSRQVADSPNLIWRV